MGDMPLPSLTHTISAGGCNTRARTLSDEANTASVDSVPECRVSLPPAAVSTNLHGATTVSSSAPLPCPVEVGPAEKPRRRCSQMGQTPVQRKVNIRGAVPATGPAYGSDALPPAHRWKTGPQAGFYFYNRTMLPVELGSLL